MKLALAIILGIFILVSCGSEPTAEEYEKELSEKIKTFKNKESKNLSDFSELLERIKAKMPANSYGGAVQGDNITLNFEKNANTFQFNYNYWADTSRLGAQNKYFWDQVNLHNLSRAIELPIDSFRPEFDGKGRNRAFTELTEDVGVKLSNAEYIVGVYPRVQVQPVWLGDVYEPGSYKGMLMIFSTETEELVASVEFEATSSSTISAAEFDDLGDAAISDFSNHVHQAFLKAMKDNFKVIGTPASIKASAGY